MHVPMYRETFKNGKWDWKDDSVGKGPTWIWSPSMYKCKRRFKIEARILPFPTYSLWQGLNQTQSSMIGASIPRQVAQRIPCLCLLRLESWVGQPPSLFSWVLVTWIMVLLFVQQVLWPLSNLPSQKSIIFMLSKHVIKTCNKTLGIKIIF